MQYSVSVVFPLTHGKLPHTWQCLTYFCMRATLVVPILVALQLSDMLQHAWKQTPSFLVSI